MRWLLGVDWCKEPAFIYPFPDSERFLCDYNLGSERLMFIVDLNSAHTNYPGQIDLSADPKSPFLPMHFATNVVFELQGILRRPSLTEMREVCNHLSETHPDEINATSFPYCDFDSYRNKDASSKPTAGRQRKRQ